MPSEPTTKDLILFTLLAIVCWVVGSVVYFLGR